MNFDLQYGQPTSYDFDTILDQFSGTKINSFRTSSIPLVQFWKNTNVRLIELLNKLDVHSDNTTLCFEYPTKPELGKGKSSMTDLMILSQDFKIAIEAKFTEYKEMKPDTINSWEEKGNRENRLKVLEYWTSLIKPFSKGPDYNSIQNINYQFYHRTASACKCIEKAVVVYQIFYDKETVDYLENYKNQLSDYVRVVNPNENLDFYIWEIEVVQRINENKEIDPFIEMKSQNIYDFIKSDLTEIKN